LAVSRIAERAWEPKPFSSREAELLAVTLQLLQEHGYERMTVDAVATTARASKATIYRRWPTKADLVVTAFVEGTRQVAGAPDTGTLRGDLLQLGEAISQWARQHAGTIRAVLVEATRNQALNGALQHQLVSTPKIAIQRILQQAVDRGEVNDQAISDELWDLLPGYLIFRAIVPNRPPSHRTVQDLVDDIIVPSLARPTR
jgi:AcrR family transcriptional regulator